MKGEKIIIKKIISLVVPIMLIITLSVTFFIKWNMRMVTGSAKDLKKITITHTRRLSYSDEPINIKEQDYTQIHHAIGSIN